MLDMIVTAATIMCPYKSFNSRSQIGTSALEDSKILLPGDVRFWLCTEKACSTKRNEQLGKGVMAESHYE
jgi:hypothetical protein